MVRKRKTLFVLWLALFPSLLFSAPADVSDISNRKYFPSVLKTIQKAEKSIFASLYYISWTGKPESKVKQLVNALSQAVQRGVQVKVVMDRGLEYVGFKDQSKKNVRSYSALKNAGIPVYYDDFGTVSHSKYLIIDEKIVIVGSFNWSERSLAKNREAALLVKSEDLAKEYIVLFKAIPKFLPEPVKGAIPIPRKFIRNRSLASKMLTRRDQTAFEFYLLVQKKSFEENSSTILISANDLKKFIFYDPKKKKTKIKDPIKKFIRHHLRFFKRKYAFPSSFNRDSSKNRLLIVLNQTNKTEGDSLYLSKIYWKNSWFKRLSFRSKFTLLYVLDKTESGRMGRFFTQSRRKAKKEYGVSGNVFASGVKQLQRYNLIERDLHFEIGGVEPNGYILNNFYVYEDFQKKLSLLKQTCSPVLSS